VRDLTRNLVLLKTVNHKILRFFRKRGKKKGRKREGETERKKVREKGNLVIVEKR